MNRTPRLSPLDSLRIQLMGESTETLTSLVNRARPHVAAVSESLALMIEAAECILAERAAIVATAKARAANAEIMRLARMMDD